MDWERLLRKALADQGWIVQELVEARSHFFLDSGGNVVRHDLVWGLFSFGNTFGGGFLRLQPSDRGGVVNTAGGAEVGLLLEVEPHEERKGTTCELKEPCAFFSP